jgi:selenide,water dikinase
MTDVTGFGLLGHLSEICEGSGLSAEINLKNVPLLDKKALDYYIEKNSIPGGTNRNFESLKEKISKISDYEKAILLDPQTSGGLLVAIDENSQDEFELFLKNHGVNELSIGRMLEGKEEKLISLV